MTTMSEWLLRLHFLLVVLLLCCVYPSSSVIIKNPVVGLVACRPRQIQAFTQFKNEFDTRGCNHSDNFNGVWCDNSTGAVTMLRLRACLRGVLKPNSSLFGFQQLRYLDLSHNNFTSSSLPSEVGNLNKLEVLGLYSNGFLGQVPSSISNLSMLAVLDLSKNEFTSSFPLVRNLTKLNALELENNYFSGTIPSSLLTMPFLAILDLKGNHLTASSIEAPNSSTSSWLEFLYLGNNHFDGKILDPISKLTNLKDLDLSFLNTSYPIDLNLFFSLKSLLSLDLSGNSIFPAGLKSDSNITLTLESLFLSLCGLTDFPSILKTLQNLEYIDISKNSIKGKVPDWLWRLPHLSTLTISNNSFSGFEGSAADILVNSSLQMLDLSLNSFKGAFPVPPLSISILSARKNGFTGNIPLSICNCRFLTYLTLPYNNLAGPIPQCLSNLTVLNLRKNNFEGSLPYEFYAGASLHTLNVGHNRLSGKLPRSLLNCSSLQFLSIDNNNMEDTFPFWLKDLPNLQVFILRSNKFYGSISPPDQGPLGFPELRILEISDNKFTGSLPPKYFVNWKASSLTINEEGSLYMQYTKTVYDSIYFTYMDNVDLQYKGLYMEQQKVFTSYSAIDFSGNKLEGEIPESVGLLKGLIALNLSNNAFTGHIPSSLANLRELESLHLSRNRLSGTIPNGLKTLSFLAYVNVSYNQLKGEIPQGPQITGQPKSSFEGNAGLCGLPLGESCFGTNSPPTQQPKEEDEEKEAQVLNWRGVAIAYGPGVLLGMAIAQVISSYKPEWLVKMGCLNKRRNR